MIITAHLSKMAKMCHSHLSENPPNIAPLFARKIDSRLRRDDTN